MAIVSGRLTDVSQIPLTGRVARLVFELSNPATASGRLFATDPVEADLDDATGYFTVDLYPTGEMIPPATYNLRVEWDGYMRMDLYTGMPVPPEGGSISDLIDWSAVPAGSVMYGYGPPPAELQDVLYVDISGQSPVLYAPDGSA